VDRAFGHPALAEQGETEVGIDHLDDALVGHRLGQRHGGARGALGLDPALGPQVSVGDVTQHARLDPAQVVLARQCQGVLEGGVRLRQLA